MFPTRRFQTLVQTTLGEEGGLPPYRYHINHLSSDPLFDDIPSTTPVVVVAVAAVAAAMSPRTSSIWIYNASRVGAVPHKHLTILVLLVDDDRQHRRDKEQYDVCDSESPSRLCESAMTGTTPHGIPTATTTAAITRRHPARAPNLFPVGVHGTRVCHGDARDVDDVGHQGHADDHCDHEARVEEGHPQCCVACAHGGDQDAEGPYRGQEGYDEETEHAGGRYAVVFVVDVDEGGKYRPTWDER